ncbi:FabD/lysophospholipase-like protein [Penicillium verhagenii]|uniref:FabD/lysophospholipase-like protein n=1 Tax=Penicillium verhagenii TaxID=1562060 RepID=UPI002545B23D|nr:FabD/lysophospholipase-like protein [Penicillium verhagenii]KAJ5930429.1 FabD/lysophospholipase-like protein [Penicillium verhagenii]
MQQEATANGGEPNPLDSAGLCLLSLDGGGVRGLSTLYILKGLMDRLNQARPEGSPARKPCEVFDLIGGTSTGGLIAIMLGRLEMDVDECIAAYIKLMKEIFGKPSKRGLSSIFGKIKPRFDAKKLESAINEVIQDCGAKPTDLFNDQVDRSCRVFVCSITQETKDIVRLRSYGNNTGIQATICQAARATSAATTFFEPVSIGARRFADGALGANDPVDEVEGEASDIWCEDTGDLKPQVKCFISIGTGNPGKKAMEDNLLKFVSKTLPNLVTQTEQTEKRFIAKWRQQYHNKRYFRFNVDQGLQDVGLAEYQEQGLIESATEGYLDHQAVVFQVRNCVENLKAKQRATNLDFTAEIWVHQKRLALLDHWQGRARWQVQFERNTRFTGRENLLLDLTQKLRQKSDATRKIAVEGLGGVGKTQLVLELAHSMRDECAICWIPVSSLANLQTAYHKVARNLRLAGCEENGVDILELVQTYLSNESIGPWLLILDNADDIELWTSPLPPEAGSKWLIDYMPQSRLGTIIWTTRDRKVATRVAQENVVTVLQMDEYVASELMRKYLIDPIGNEEQPTLLRLLQRLSYLPLAIVQAAAYINSTHATQGSLGEYEELLSRQDDQVIERLSQDFGDHGRYSGTDNAVAKTWLISFEQIRRRSPLAIQYMGLMACVDPKAIPRSLLQPSERLSSHQQRDALGILDAFSFLTEHKGGLAFDMHRLVHLATRQWLKMNGELPDCHRQAVVRLNELLLNIDGANRTFWRLYVAHAQQAVAGHDKDSEEKADLAMICGTCLNEDGRYHEAEIMYHISLNFRERVLGPEHRDTLLIISNLGSVLDLQGKYKDAEVYCRRAAQGQERLLGLEHRDTLTSLRNLAEVLCHQGKYEESEAMFQQVFERLNKVLEPNHPDILMSMASLGLGNYYQGKLKEAEVLCRQALQNQERELGPKDVQTLTSVNNLGSILGRQGKFKEAEALHRRALQEQEKILGSEHLCTLLSLGNIAQALSHQGKFKEAEVLFRQYFEGSKKVLGPEHPHTLNGASSLGYVLTGQGRYKEAEALYRQVLLDRERVLGPEHPETIVSVNDFGFCLSYQGKYQEAEAFHQRALQNFKKVLRPEHPNIFGSLGNLGLALFYQGKFKEAEVSCRQHFEGSEKVLGPEHPDTLTGATTLGLALSRQSKYKEAEAVYRQVLQDQERVLGLEHPSTVNSVKDFGFVLFHQGKYQEAEAIYRRMLERSERVLGPEHPETLIIIRDLQHLRSLNDSSALQLQSSNVDPKPRQVRRTQSLG